MNENLSTLMAMNGSDQVISFDDDATLPTYGLAGFQILISTVYSLVCATGLLGNVFVMYLIRAKKATGLTAIDVFVFCLALTDFQFALTLPFWAVDAVMDFSWPFGHVMCKFVLTMTVLNVYNNVFLLTAMAMTRYWAVASALSFRGRVSSKSAKWISLALWLLAICITIPTTVFASTSKVLGEDLCLLKFPDNKWLATYHLQRVIIGFAIPLVVISLSYVMLLNFLRQHKVNAKNRHRQSKITNSVQMIIVVFFICWFPNHAAIFWGILVKYEAVQWSYAYYYFHTFVFPITLCFAHSNSCLNPVIYCLIRKEFRTALKASFLQIATLVASYLPSRSGKNVTLELETTLPLYRKTSFPQTFSTACAVGSVTTITATPEHAAKDKTRPNGEQTRLESFIE